MWFLVDISLVGLTLLHFMMMWAAATPVDSPLKKPLTNAMLMVDVAVDRPSLKMGGIGLLLATICATSVGAWDDITLRTRVLAALFNLLSVPLYMKLAHTLVTLGPKRILQFEEEVMAEDIQNFSPPPLAIVDRMMAPMNLILQHEVVGLERVPTDYPCLYVMNHSLMGFEMPAFIHTLYKAKGVFLRGLADHFHWAGPQGPILRAFGAVDGNRSNVDLLMNRQENILVYPGGGAEIMKGAHVERYTLMWKERLGFAKMAIKHGYPILPCACVGTEDMLDILVDLPVSYFRISHPTVPVVVPNSLQKMYFWFGDPIPTAHYNGDSENLDNAREVRDKAKAAIETGIKEMQQKHADDPDRYTISKLAKKIKDVQATSLESLQRIFGDCDAKGD